MIPFVAIAGCSGSDSPDLLRKYGQRQLGYFIYQCRIIARHSNEIVPLARGHNLHSFLRIASTYSDTTGKSVESIASPCFCDAQLLFSKETLQDDPKA